jgi:hypothetical protein
MVLCFVRVYQWARLAPRWTVGDQQEHNFSPIRESSSTYGGGGDDGKGDRASNEASGVAGDGEQRGKARNLLLSLSLSLSLSMVAATVAYYKILSLHMIPSIYNKIV